MLKQSSAFTAVLGLLALAACGEVSGPDSTSPELRLNQGKDGGFVRFAGVRIGDDGNNITGSGHGREMRDGSVQGSIQFNNRSLTPNVLQAKGTVDCIVFLNDDEAIIGGVITDVIKNWLPFEWEGFRWSTAVRDESAGGGTGTFRILRPLNEFCSTALDYGHYSTTGKGHNMVDP